MNRDGVAFQPTFRTVNKAMGRAYMEMRFPEDGQCSVSFSCRCTGAGELFGPPDAEAAASLKLVGYSGVWFDGGTWFRDLVADDVI